MIMVEGHQGSPDVRTGVWVGWRTGGRNICRAGASCGLRAAGASDGLRAGASGELRAAGASGGLRASDRNICRAVAIPVHLWVLAKD